MTNLQKVTKIIQEANPNILSNNTSMLLEGEFHGIINYRDKKINLEHVLVAMEKQAKEKHGDAIDIWVGEGSSFRWKDDFERKALRMLRDWKPLTSLHLQDQPTIDFLLETLTS